MCQLYIFRINQVVKAKWLRSKATVYKSIQDKGFGLVAPSWKRRQAAYVTVGLDIFCFLTEENEMALKLRGHKQIHRAAA